MSDIKIHIRQKCEKCHGRKVFPNDDELTRESQAFIRCIWCDGTGDQEKWVTLVELLELSGKP